MKKSTLTKIICLAVLCLMVLPLIMSCGKKCTVIFDPNGGTITKGEDTVKVKEGEMIGSFPTVTRDGFKFAGWYDEEDTNFEEKISKRDFVMYDMILVAKWEKDENTVSVEFVAGEGELAESDAIKYVQKGDNVGKLPTPTREGYTFDCWVLEDDSTVVVRQTTVIKSNTVCVAKWNRIIYCNDGTENHTWSGWQEVSQATCDTPQRNSRICTTCQHTEYNDGEDAKGHEWSEWSDEFLKRSRLCYECNKTDYEHYENITVSALGGKKPEVAGTGWGLGDTGCIVNGTLEENGSLCFCGDGKGAITVTLNLVEPTAVDLIYVVGIGSKSFEVTVTYEDGTTAMLGIGSFGAWNQYNVFNVDGKFITKVVINMASPSNGQDFWTEVALGKTTTSE